MRHIIRQFLSFLKKWFWSNPTDKVPEKRVAVKATEVVHAYVMVEYKGTKIPIRKSELPMWNAMSNSDKKKMAFKFTKAKQKGQLQAVWIGGQKIFIPKQAAHEAEQRANRG